MNLFAISGLACGISCTVLALIALIFGKAKIHRILTFFNISVAIWGYGCFIVGIAPTESVSLLGWRFGQTGGIFISVFFYHMICIFCGLKRRIPLIITYAWGVFFLYFCFFSNLLFTRTIFIYDVFYNRATPLYAVLVFSWLFIVCLSFLELLRYLPKTKGTRHTQIFYIIFGFMIGFIGGSSTLIPMFGINLYPFGNFTIPLYCIILTYAVVKHHLMDINIVIRKGFVYSILITIFTLIYLGVVIFSERFFQGIFGYRSIFTSILFASIIALIFIPLKNRIQSFIDKIFLGRTSEEIAQENELLRQELMRSEKLKAVATFASGMAHEIKNPLTAIKTFTEYLPQKMDNKEFLHKFSNIIGSEVEKIDDLVHQLLDFSKPAPLQLKETDIHKVIDETLELLSSQFIRHHINVKKDYSNSNIIIEIDFQQMKQAFLNLFLNAIEAMPNGGEIFIRTNQQSNQLMISIQDTGYGISETDLPHIFEPFYSTKEKGSGLGLSIVYNIIKEHRGNIKVENKIKQGTRFIIELPITNF